MSDSQPQLDEMVNTLSSKIENMDKLSGRTIGLDFIVSKMVYNRATYLIFLNDMLGSHKRYLKLHRYPSSTKT